MPNNPTVADKISNTDDFKNALDALCFDLSDAHNHYQLFDNLLVAAEGEYAKAVSQSQAFWSLVYGANFDAAVFRLCRVYDQERGALTLRTVLETITAGPAYLPALRRPLDQVMLDADLKWSHQDSNPLVGNLMIWRHNVYAHRAAEKKALDRLADYPVTHDDVRALLGTGFEIVNRYKIAFFGTSMQRNIIGSDDYLKVLRTLQDSVEAIEAKFRAEVERAKKENS